MVSELKTSNINFILDIGNGKVEELITYNQLLDHIEQAEENDASIDQQLFNSELFLGMKILLKPQIQIGRVANPCPGRMGHWGNHL